MGLFRRKKDDGGVTGSTSPLVDRVEVWHGATRIAVYDDLSVADVFGS
jgi:hypothetical protein